MKIFTNEYSDSWKTELFPAIKKYCKGSVGFLSYNDPIYNIISEISGIPVQDLKTGKTIDLSKYKKLRNVLRYITGDITVRGSVSVEKAVRVVKDSLFGDDILYTDTFMLHEWKIKSAKNIVVYDLPKDGKLAKELIKKHNGLALSFNGSFPKIADADRTVIMSARGNNVKEFITRLREKDQWVTQKLVA